MSVYRATSLYTHTHTQDSDCRSPPIKKARLSDDTLSPPSPPTRPGDLTSTDESGSLCPTVESPVRLESQEPVKSETGEELISVYI